MREKPKISSRVLSGKKKKKEEKKEKKPGAG
jgi:hypothetical protein